MSSFIVTLALPDATGAAQMTYHFCAALQTAGHRVVLVHGPEPNGLTAAEAQPTILREMKRAGIETVAEPRLAFPITRAVRRHVVTQARRVNAAAVIGVMQRDRAVALQAAREIGIPGIVSAQNQHVFWGPWPLPLVKRAYYRRALSRLASLVICTSEAVQREIVHEFRVPSERTRVLPNAIDVREFAPVDPAEATGARRELGVEPDELMLINVGRLDLQKGQDVLIRALAYLSETRPPVKLVLVGGVAQGPAAARTKRFERALKARVAASALEGRVTFAGWRTDVRRLLGSADVYVHSARWEGSALAVMEALASRLPVVTTNCSGWPSGFVNGTHGWVVDKEDPAALAKALGRAVSLNHRDMAAMGRACRELAEERYDIRPVARRFVELVETEVHGDG